MLQTISIINIIELIFVHGDIFSRHRKLPQNFTVVIAVSGRLLQIFFQCLRPAFIFSERLQISLDALTDLLPLLLCDLQLFRRFPQ